MENALAYALPPGGKGVEYRFEVPHVLTDSSGRCRLAVPADNRPYDVGVLHEFSHVIRESLRPGGEVVEIRLPAPAEVRIVLPLEARESMQRPLYLEARLASTGGADSIGLPGRGQRPSIRKRHAIVFQADGVGLLHLQPGEEYMISFRDLKPGLIPTPKSFSAPATIALALVDVLSFVLDYRVDTGHQPQSDTRDLVINLDWGAGATGDSTIVRTFHAGQSGPGGLPLRVWGRLHAVETTLRWSGRGVTPGQVVIRRPTSGKAWMSPKVLVQVPDLRALPLSTRPLRHPVDVSVLVGGRPGGKRPSQVTLRLMHAPYEAILGIPSGVMNVDTQLPMKKGDWICAYDGDSFAATPLRYDGSGRRLDLRVREAGLAQVSGALPPRALGVASMEVLNKPIVTRMSWDDSFEDSKAYMGAGPFPVEPDLEIGPLPVGTYRYAVILGGIRVAEREFVIERGRVARVPLSAWSPPPR